MEIITSIDWRTVAITLAVAILLFNAVQIVRYMLVKKKAEEEIKKINAKIASVEKELEDAKKSLTDSIKSLSE